MVKYHYEVSHDNAMKRPYDLIESNCIPPYSHKYPHYGWSWLTTMNHFLTRFMSLLYLISPYSMIRSYYISIIFLLYSYSNMPIISHYYLISKWTISWSPVPSRLSRLKDEDITHLEPPWETAPRRWASDMTWYVGFFKSHDISPIFHISPINIKYLY